MANFSANDLWYFFMMHNFFLGFVLVKADSLKTLGDL